MIWEKLKWFIKGEAWGNPDEMNGCLLLLLDAVREIVGQQFVIHCGYETEGHTPSSQHYLGNAVDFHILTTIPFQRQIDIMEATLNELQVADVVGLGLYPDWQNPGFHLDIRGNKARWGRVVEYVSFDKAYDYARGIK